MYIPTRVTSLPQDGGKKCHRRPAAHTQQRPRAARAELRAHRSLPPGTHSSCWECKHITDKETPSSHLAGRFHLPTACPAERRPSQRGPAHTITRAHAAQRGGPPTFLQGERALGAPGSVRKYSVRCMPHTATQPKTSLAKQQLLSRQRTSQHISQIKPPDILRIHPCMQGQTHTTRPRPSM